MMPLLCWPCISPSSMNKHTWRSKGCLWNMGSRQRYIMHLRVADIAVQSHAAQVPFVHVRPALGICAVLQGRARRAPLAPDGDALLC